MAFVDDGRCQSVLTARHPLRPSLPNIMIGTIALKALQDEQLHEGEGMTRSDTIGRLHLTARRWNLRIQDNEK